MDIEEFLIERRRQREAGVPTPEPKWLDVGRHRREHPPSPAQLEIDRTKHSLIPGIETAVAEFREQQQAGREGGRPRTFTLPEFISNSIPADPEIRDIRLRRSASEIEANACEIVSVPLPEAQASRQKQQQEASETGVFLPENSQFGTFYQELSAYGGLKSAGWDGRTLRMKSACTEISVAVDAVIEMLAEKMNQPLPIDKSTETVTGRPPFIDDMNQVVQARMNSLKMEFNRIIALGDPRIEKLCQDYHKAASYPFLTRIRYMEWERSLLGWRIQQSIEKLDMEKESELKNIRNDYAKQKQAELSRKEATIQKLKSENHQLATVNEHLNSKTKAIKEEKDALQMEIQTIFEKKKDIEKEKESLETNFHIEKSKRKEAETRIESLLNRIERLSQKRESITTKPKSKTQEIMEKDDKPEAVSKLSPTDQAILDFLKETGKKSAQEISEGTDIPLSSVMLPLIALAEGGFIEKSEDEEAGGAVFSIPE